MHASDSTSRDALDSRPLPGGWLVVGLLWGVGCLNYIDRVMLNTMRDSIKAAIPMGEDDFGFLTTAFLVVYGVLSPIGGWFADRFSRRLVVIFSLAVWSLITWLTSYAHTYHQLLATRAIMGISEACYIPGALALIADYHRGSTRSLATGIHMSGLYAGVALGGMGGWVAEHHGWAASFFSFGCIGVAYAIVLVWLLRDAPVARDARTEVPPVHPLEAARCLGGNTVFWIVAAQWGLTSFAGWGFVTWMPTFLKEHFHLTQTYAGFSGTAYTQIAALVGVLAGGAWADRWSRTQRRARAWVPMIGLSVAAPFIFLTACTPLLGIAIVGLVAFGLGRGCIDANMMPLICQVSPSRYRATSYGVLNLLGCTVGGAAAYLGGWLREQKLDLSYQIMGSAVLVLFAGLLLAFVKPTRDG